MFDRALQMEGGRVELRQLQYFVAVAEEQNFGRAAQRLNVSQPPVTRQVRKLEEELGATLLTRTTKGAVLTAAGEVFLEDARRVLAGLARARERAASAQRGELGRLEIGYFGSVSYSAVPEVLGWFRSLNPGVRLELRRMSKSEQMDALKSGDLHMGFGRYYAEDPELQVEEILKDSLSLAVARGEDDARSAESLITDPLILFPREGRPNFADEVLHFLTERGLNPRVAATVEDIRSAITLTALGVGVTVVPSSVSHLNWTGVRFTALPDTDGFCPVSCIYRKGDTSPLLRNLQLSIRKFRSDTT